MDFHDMKEQEMKEWMEGLGKGQKRIEKHIEELAQAQKRVEERVEELVKTQKRKNRCLRNTLVVGGVVFALGIAGNVMDFYNNFWTLPESFEKHKRYSPITYEPIAKIERNIQYVLQYKNLEKETPLFESDDKFLAFSSYLVNGKHHSGEYNIKQPSWYNFRHEAIAGSTVTTHIGEDHYTIQHKYGKADKGYAVWDIHYEDYSMSIYCSIGTTNPIHGSTLIPYKSI